MQVLRRLERICFFTQCNGKLVKSFKQRSAIILLIYIFLNQEYIDNQDTPLPSQGTENTILKMLKAKVLKYGKK